MKKKKKNTKWSKKEDERLRSATGPLERFIMQCNVISWYFLNFSLHVKRGEMEPSPIPKDADIQAVLVFMNLFLV